NDWRVFWLRANRDNPTVGELEQQKLQRSEAVGFLRYHLEWMRLINGGEGSPRQSLDAGDSQDDSDQAILDLHTAMALHLHQPLFNIIRPTGGEGAPGMNDAQGQSGDGHLKNFSIRAGN
ncbi:hypothetical protein HK405_012833, partial [Cladochytrium tenue]